MGAVKCLIYLALLGLASQLIGMSLPRRLFDRDGFLFRARGFEKGGRIYERLGIRRWKDKVPDMSRIVKSMEPKSIKTAFSAEAADRMIRETCVAELTHLLLALLGFPCVLLWQGWGWLAWGLYALGNMPFVMIQRYNRPRYVAVLKRYEARGQS